MKTFKPDGHSWVPIAPITVSQTKQLKMRRLLMDDDSNHTCDACGPAVKARAIIITANNGFLTYCAHHVKRWRTNLENQGATIYPIEE